MFTTPTLSMVRAIQNRIVNMPGFLRYGHILQSLVLQIELYTFKELHKYYCRVAPRLRSQSYTIVPVLCVHVMRGRYTSGVSRRVLRVLEHPPPPSLRNAISSYSDILVYINSYCHKPSFKTLCQAL